MQDVWIVCDNRVLLTSVFKEDVTKMQSVWDDYNLTRSVGPYEHSTFGIIDSFSDDRFFDV